MILTLSLPNAFIIYLVHGSKIGLRCGLPVEVHIAPRLVCSFSLFQLTRKTILHVQPFSVVPTNAYCVVIRQANIYGDLGCRMVVCGNATARTLAEIIIPYMEWLHLPWSMEQPVPC